MKKIIISFLIIIFSIQHSACSSPLQTITLREKIISSELIHEPVIIEKKLLIDSDEIKVYTPWIANDKYDHSNEKIESFINSYVDEKINDYWTDEDFINIDYTVTYNKNDILSLYFIEESYQYSRPHENLIGISINLQDRSFISNNDLFVVNEFFLQDLLSYREDEYDREEHVIEYLMDIYGTEGILEQIENKELMNCYFSQEYIFISFSLPQALTYHMEMGIRWEQTIAP